MDVDLKHLKALLQLCRKQGVTEIKLSGIEFKLGDLPSEGKPNAISDQNEIESDNPYANFPDGILSPEQLAFYSAGGVPEEDPFINKPGEQ